MCETKQFHRVFPNRMPCRCLWTTVPRTPRQKGQKEDSILERARNYYISKTCWHFSAVLLQTTLSDVDFLKKTITDNRKLSQQWHDPKEKTPNLTSSKCPFPESGFHLSEETYQGEQWLLELEVSYSTAWCPYREGCSMESLQMDFFREWDPLAGPLSQIRTARFISEQSALEISRT